MEIKKLSLPEIAVIGKEGMCTKGNNIAAKLWAEATEHFSEVAELGKKNPDGSFAGFWGAMSDAGMNFLPWEDDFSAGMYLAGLEVDAAAQAPAGWTKWVLPARDYLIADISAETYGEVFAEMTRIIIPELKLKLSGAVCDFTDPATGVSRLYFPVEEE